MLKLIQLQRGILKLISNCLQFNPDFNKILRVQSLDVKGKWVTKGQCLPARSSAGANQPSQIIICPVSIWRQRDGTCSSYSIMPIPNTIGNLTKASRTKYQSNQIG